jgi:drug/metabolite transporter (DMT)-like permease
VLTGFALPALGDALVLLNALSYALYVVYVRGSIARYGSLAVIAWVFGWGALFYAPFGLGPLLREAPTWPAPTVGLVAFLVLVPTVMAYGCNVWALGRAKPSLVTTYVFLQPLLVVILGWLQLGQALSSRVALAALFIVAGVGVVALRRTRASGPQAAQRQAAEASPSPST